MILLSVPICDFFSLTTRNSLTPAGYPIIQLISCTFYLEIDSFISHRLQAQSCKTSPNANSGARCKSALSPLVLTNGLCISGSNSTLLGFDLFARVAYRTQRNSDFIDHWFVTKGIARWKR